MIITRSVRLVVRPRDFESITLEGTVSHDFGEADEQETAHAIATVQSALDELMRTDVNEAVACVPEETASFIDLWKQEVYQ